MLERLPIRVASDARGEAVSLDLAAEATHLVVQAMSRFGKSSLAQHIIGSALSASSAVAVAGADPSGILLHPLRNQAHPEWRSIGGADMRSHVAALGGVVAELDRRLTILLDREVDKLTAFDVDLPLLLVVLEEYPGLLAAAEDDDAATGRRAGERYAPAIRRDVARLVRESAKVGFRLVTITQRADAAILGGNERSNYATRATLRVDNPDAVRMLHPYCPDELIDAAHRLPPGVGLFESPEYALRRVRFPHVTYADYLAAVRQP